MKDLVVLCPDLTWRSTLEPLLSRCRNLGIRPVESEVMSVPGNTDGWVRRMGVEFLRTVGVQFRHGILLFDHDGCGDGRPAAEIEVELDTSLRQDWGDRAAAVVVDPELEEWIIGSHAWLSNLPQLCRVQPREWLCQRGYWPEGQDKPGDPKEALHRLFEQFRVPRSAATYRKIAQNASLRPERCRSRSYRRFVEQLRRWFSCE